MEIFNALMLSIASGLGYAIKLIINMRKEVLQNTNDIDVLKKEKEDLKNEIIEMNSEMKKINENMVVINELKISIKYIEESMRRILDKMDDK